MLRWKCDYKEVQQKTDLSISLHGKTEKNRKIIYEIMDSDVSVMMVKSFLRII